MYKQALELLPINRSLTGNGVRQTFNYLKTIVPELKIIEVPSGTKAFDWTVPDEWNIENAFIADEKGIPIVNSDKNTLMSVGCVLVASAAFGKEMVAQVRSLVGSQVEVNDDASR